MFAGLANRDGAAAKIFRRYFKWQFSWLTSRPVLAEYRGVLSTSEKIDQTRLRLFFHLLKKRSFEIDIPEKLQVCRDPDDDKFLETAVLGNADFLVTKNLKHFPRKSFNSVRIVTVSKFLDELEKSFP